MWFSWLIKAVKGGGERASVIGALLNMVFNIAELLGL